MSISRPLQQRRQDSSFVPAWFCLFVLMLLYPTFLWLLPRSVTLITFYVGLCLVLVVALVTPSRSRRLGAVSLYLPLGVLAFAGTLLNDAVNPDFIFLLGTIVLACVLPHIRRWESAYVHAVMCIFGIHAVATIVFFLIPSLYPQVISGTPIDSFPTAIDYRSGLTAHYSYNGMYNAIGFVVAIPLALSGARARARVSYFLMAILFAIALLLTTKRGPLLFAVLTMFAVLIVARWSTSRAGNAKKRKSYFWGVLFILGAVVWFVAVNPTTLDVLDRFFMESGDLNELTSGRTLLWQHALDLWGASPLLGTGWGGYRVTWNDGGTIVTSVSAHNVVLNLLAETGVIGASIFICAFVAVLIRTLKAVRVAGGSGLGRMNLGHSWLLVSVSVQVFFGLYSLVGNPLYDAPTVAAYFMAIAMVVSVDGGSDEVDDAARKLKKPIGSQKP